MRLFHVFLIDARGAFRCTFRPLSRSLADGYAKWCAERGIARGRIVVLPA
jgi:hypothetical protein